MKIKNQDLPIFDLVVTRHIPLVEWLRREGHVSEATPVVEHAHADVHQARVVHAGSGYEVHAGHRLLGHEVQAESTAQDFADQHNAANVRGKHVVGVLPHHLSCKAASVTEVQLDWTRADREAMQRGDVDIDAVARAARGLHTYHVSQARPRGWSVFEAAQDFAEGCLGMCLFDSVGSWRGLPTVKFCDAGQSLWGEVLINEGLWRRFSGPWIDALGREVDDASIMPSPSWGFRIRHPESTAGQEPNAECHPRGWPGDRRWETFDDVLAELPSLGFDHDVEILRGSEWGANAFVSATWTPDAA